MGLLKRIFGICEVKAPTDAECWEFSNGKIEIGLGRAPELSDRDSAIRLEGRGLPIRVLVLNGNDGKFHAFENKCTHMGRRLDPVAGDASVQCCSVFRSHFDYTGKVLSGAAKKPLKTLKADVIDDRLTILIE